MSKNDDCMKRAIKAYLFFKGEASTNEILHHIDSVGYGITKAYTVTGLSKYMKRWAEKSMWFNVEKVRDDRKQTYWRLKQ